MKKIILTLIGMIFLVGFVVAYTAPTYSDIDLVLDSSYTAPTYSSIDLVLGEAATYLLNITDPLISDPENISSADNITVTFNFTSDNVPITSGVTMENVTIGGSYATILSSASSKQTDFNDTFIEGTDTNLDSHTPSQTGTGWTKSAQTGIPTLVVESTTNNLRVTGDLNEYVIYTADDVPSSSEYNISLTLTTVDGGDDLTFLAGRYTDVTHSYQVTFSSTIAENKLRYLNGGSVIVLDTASTAVANGDKIIFEITNSAKNVYKNGVLWMNSADNTITSTGKAGLGCGDWMGDGAEDCDQIWRLDDFSIESMSAASNQFEYVSGTGWQVNVTAPDFSDGFKDLYLNATYGGTTYNDTESNAIYYGAADTCTYVSGNWEVNCSDNCTITSNVDLGGNNITFSNDYGHFNVVANISNFNQLAKYDNCELRIFQGGFK